MLNIVGNGPSQKDIDWSSFKDEEWWGFNAVRDTPTKPDLLFCVDIEVQAGIVKEEYYKTNKVAFAEFNTVPIEMWDMMKIEFSKWKHFIEIRNEGDTEFSIQGDFDYEEAYFIGINGEYIDNIITYDYPDLKNLFGGPSALGYAIAQGHKDICLMCMYALEHGDPTSIFADSGLFKYKTKYTKDDRVFHTQQQQFLALLKKHEDINVYWRKPIDGLTKIDYNVLDYENSEEWILGRGHPSETS